jgi:hypothetical protein
MQETEVQESRSEFMHERIPPSVVLSVNLIEPRGSAVAAFTAQSFA